MTTLLLALGAYGVYVTAAAWLQGKAAQAAVAPASPAPAPASETSQTLDMGNSSAASSANAPRIGLPVASVTGSLPVSIPTSNQPFRTAALSGNLVEGGQIWPSGLGIARIMTGPDGRPTFLL